VKKMEDDEMDVPSMEEEEAVRGVFTRQDFKLISFLLENKDIPKDLKKMFWAFGSRVMALTNFTDDDVKMMMYDWHDAKITYMMSRPYYKYTYDEELAISNFEAWFRAMIRRSVGGGQRERVIIASHISQRMGEIEEVPRGGIMQGVKKLFGMGGR